MAAIVGVLGRGLWSMYAGQKEASYRMMRYRVVFQVGTIAALVFGMYFRQNDEASDVNAKGTIVDKRFFMDYAREIKSVQPAKKEELK